MFTGLDTDKCKLYKKYCLSLGGSVTGNPKLCTHLISEKIVRTVKFLCGISVCRYILAPLWIEKSFANGRFVEEEPFLLHDVHGEDTYQMKLETSLCRACQAKLLDGIVFFATPNVSPMYDDLKMIIECAGGTLLKDRELKSRYGRRLELLDSSGVKLIILTCQLDVESCRELLRNHQEHQYIYNAEFVLTGVLRQALDYNSNKISL
jgi:PAX-interacting protein 1